MHKDEIARQKEENLDDQFLDTYFQSGKIIFKNGTSIQDNLNYHIPSNFICHINEKKELFSLVNLSDILMISYGDRTFIPIDNTSVAELLKTFSDGSRLLLQRQAKSDKKTKNTGAYGISTETASVTRIKSVSSGGSFVGLEIGYNEELIMSERFIIVKNGKNYIISRLKSLKKIYRSKWEEIEEYAKQNNTNLKNHQDLIDLLEFCTN
jgi:hypothetical protein